MKQFEKITKTLCRTLMALLMLAFTLASHAAVESITYITTDHLGSPIMATDQSGAVLWREDYLPYGVQLVQEDEDSSVGFTGHLDEKTLDVTYMQGRWYHPEVGRFLAIDPVGFVEGNPMSFNRYAYANNNPYKYIDPDGRWIEDALLGIPSIIVGADSFSTNIANGNYLDAAVDVAGMIYDVAATATPGVPGGAGLSILVSRKAASGPLHHICTNKNCVSAASGGPWTPRFEAIFEKAGMNLDDALNKVRVPGHKGPHPEAYHQAVFDRLTSATDGLTGSAYTSALQSELRAIGEEASKPGSVLNKLLTKQ